MSRFTELYKESKTEQHWITINGAHILVGGPKPISHSEAKAKESSGEGSIVHHGEGGRLRITPAGGQSGYDVHGSGLFGNGYYVARDIEEAKVFGDKVTTSFLPLKQSEILTVDNKQLSDLYGKALEKYGTGKNKLPEGEIIPKYVKDLGYKAIEGTTWLDGINIFDKEVLQEISEEKKKHIPKFKKLWKDLNKEQHWITVNGAHVLIEGDEDGEKKINFTPSAPTPPKKPKQRKPASPDTPEKDKVIARQQVLHALSDLNHPAGKKLMEDKSFVNEDYKSFDELKQAIKDKLSVEELNELLSSTPSEPHGSLERVFHTKEWYVSDNGPFNEKGNDIRYKLYETVGEKSMKNFKEVYKEISPHVKEELEGADKYHEIGDKFHEMAEDEEGHAETIRDILAGKARVEKPGVATHTPKFDSCVEQVKASGKGANAYAVCTSMLGNEAFKSMDDKLFKEKIDFYMHKLGIAGAGPVPDSLLSRQDLEGDETQKRMDLWLWRQDKHVGGQEIEWKEDNKSMEKTIDLNNFAVWYYDTTGAQKCAVFGSAIDAKSYARIVDGLGYKNVKIMKGQFERTGKELKETAGDAKDAGEKETKSLVERIKGIQIKRQKTVLSMRGAEANKSFRQKWGEIVGRLK